MKMRDRALAALNGEEVYPIPHDVFESWPYPELRAGLCQHFSLAECTTEGVLRALNAHMRRGRVLYAGPPLEELHIEGAVPWPEKKTSRNIWGGCLGLETYSEAVKVERVLQSVETVADVETESGDVAETLRRRAAQTGADMIVMGAFVHSRLRQLVLGGTTQSLLKRSPVPLFLSY